MPAPSDSNPSHPTSRASGRNRIRACDSATPRIASIAALVLCAAFAFSACQADGGTLKQVPDEPPRSEKEQCRASGGEWIMFNNGCVDMCEYRRGEVTMCTQVRKLGCYCKGHRCWNGSRCEDV